MKNLKKYLSSLSCDEFDEIQRPAPETVEFEKILDQSVNRRRFLQGSTLLFGSGLFVQSSLAQTMSKTNETDFDVFQFSDVKANSDDTITLPKSYRWKPMVSWGDPMWSKGTPFDSKNLVTETSQALAFGDNNDGMKHFSVDGKELLAINNEYINFASFYSNRASGLPESEADTIKAKLAVGVSIIEVSETKDGWEMVQDSTYNRRINALTAMDITGPAKGHPLIQTADDPKGVEILGTWNNCGSGKTPWGTYLTCEENFNGFYQSTNPDLQLSDELKRYGISHNDRGYDWGKFDARFDLAKTPNEPNRSGFVVEIDPANPNSKPKKRSALGRFKHENAEMVIAENGKVVVYLGDDERGEYLYRYVSNNVYKAGADVDDLMDNGTLYVAKFNEDGTGKWQALTEKTTAMSQAEICIHTRQAASAVDATTMDRPEWVAVNPNKAEVYCALTNNKNRGIKTNKGGDEQPVGGPNPREKNKYGQVVRWTPEKGDHTATDFEWNLFVLAGNPTVHKEGLKAGSKNIHAGNMFNAPDGVHFDSKGKLWIQTDGKYSNKGDFQDMGNNQMLLANPETGEIKRFMVGPKECEITGFAHSNDKKTLFVGIQHPGEKGDSTFPNGDVARSTVIAIWHQDGHEIA